MEIDRWMYNSEGVWNKSCTQTKGSDVMYVSAEYRDLQTVQLPISWEREICGQQGAESLESPSAVFTPVFSVSCLFLGLMFINLVLDEWEGDFFQGPNCVCVLWK